MKVKKIKPNPTKLITIYGSFVVVLVLIMILAFGSRFSYLDENSMLVISKVIIDVIILGVSIFAFIFGSFFLVNNSYYEVTKTALIQHKGKNTLIYDFKDILYIDHPYTLKHNTLMIYTAKGDTRFFVLDTKKELYHLVKENAHNLISKEEYNKRFPKNKIK